MLVLNLSACQRHGCGGQCRKSEAAHGDGTTRLFGGGQQGVRQRPLGVTYCAMEGPGLRRCLVVTTAMKCRRRRSSGCEVEVQAELWSQSSRTWPQGLGEKTVVGGEPRVFSGGGGAMAALGR